MTGSLEAAETSRAVSLLVARKAMDVGAQQGEAAIALMEAAAELARAPRPASLGEHQVDLYA